MLVGQAVAVMQPLLVLPKEAAAEMQQLWDNQVQLLLGQSADNQQSVPGVAELLTCWSSSMVPLSVDIAFVLGGCDSSAGDWHEAQSDNAAVLQHLLQHLARAGMWATIQHVLQAVQSSKNSLDQQPDGAENSIRETARGVMRRGRKLQLPMFRSWSSLHCMLCNIHSWLLQLLQHLGVTACWNLRHTSTVTYGNDSTNFGSLLHAVLFGFSSQQSEGRYLVYKQSQSVMLDYVALLYYGLLATSSVVGYPSSAPAWPVRISRAGFLIPHALPPLLIVLLKPALGIARERASLLHELTLAIGLAGVGGGWIQLSPKVAKMFGAPGSWTDAAGMWAAMAPTRAWLSQVRIQAQVRG